MRLKSFHLMKPEEALFPEFIAQVGRNIENSAEFAGFVDELIQGARSPSGERHLSVSRARLPKYDSKSRNH